MQSPALMGLARQCTCRVDDHAFGRYVPGRGLESVNRLYVARRDTGQLGAVVAVGQDHPPWGTAASLRRDDRVEVEVSEFGA